MKPLYHNFFVFFLTFLLFLTFTLSGWLISSMREENQTLKQKYDNFTKQLFKIKIDPQTENCYDLLTKKIVQKNKFFSDGKTVDFIEEFNENEQLTKKTFFQIDGKTRNFTDIYDVHSHKIKTIFFRTDGKRQDRIIEYNQTNQLTTETIFQEDGKTVQKIIQKPYKAGMKNN
ncbi:DUF2963 domain-containing protein [Candidatus Phytoplasma pruni]|uniref:DUF2963 domain-containing protein n=1 Tax=Candidatus Phytoplasma pruni TaxID=479893 RepID=A0A851HIA6_9MOLU|nr:DUF2963 domain-containing protein [Candidatus Phytoplasma pruni]NWN46034.1 DUF2963 domain-containing protein [Candidatus Phytoplasma pruni]